MNKVLDFTCRFIASVGFIGYVPLAPGTVCSAIAALFFFFLPEISLSSYLAILGVLLVLGFVTSSYICRHGIEKDPSWVVIDEMVGMGIVLIGLPKVGSMYFVAFGLFRFFDIVKPYPINKLEDFPGGFGILLDDVLSGVVALVLMQLIGPYP